MDTNLFDPWPLTLTPKVRGQKGIYEGDISDGNVWGAGGGGVFGVAYDMA